RAARRERRACTRRDRARHRPGIARLAAPARLRRVLRRGPRACCMTLARAVFALTAIIVIATAQESTLARETAPAPAATFEALFTPGDAIDARLAALIDGAQREVLVNAFSFTSRRIARALAAAHARGVRVELV